MDKPVKKLENEHHIIEEMLDILRDNIEDIEGGKLSLERINQLSDFFLTYTDKYHHAKEEKIIIPQLNLKDVKEIDKMIMDELIEEHKYVKKVVKQLVNAKNLYEEDKAESLVLLSDSLWRLFRFYPLHAEKEDTNFFDYIEVYFSEDEQNRLSRKMDKLNEEFDYDYYQNLVSEFEKEFS